MNSSPTCLSITTTPIPAGRLPVLDELKGVAIILVVLYHAGGVLAWGNQLHGDLGVDIFVILSGLGLTLGRPFRSAGEFLRRRLLRVMPTYWLVLTAFLLLNSHFLQHTYSVANIALHFVGLHGWFGDPFAFAMVDSFWFITFILTLYFLFVGLRLSDAPVGRVIWMGAVTSVVIALGLTLWNQPGAFGHMGLRTPGFFVGILAGRWLREGRLDLAFTPSMVMAAFILLYVPYTQGIVFHTVVVAGVLMLAYGEVARTRLPTEGKTRRVLAFLGAHSFEIFLIHQPVIRDYNYYLHGRWLGVTQPGASSLIVGMALGLAVTLIASVELHRLIQRLDARIFRYP